MPFEDTIARMKELYTYGRELNENSKPNNYTLEYKATAADGKTYGIIRECSKFYIKAARKGKENLAEAYNYIGGCANKKDYEYPSYSSALKSLEAKLKSINEACDSQVEIESLDQFTPNNQLMTESSQSMKDEIARYKQIMHNVSAIMNEATEIGASRKDDVVKFDGANPEAETGKKGDEEYSETKANPEFEGTKTNGVDTKAEPFKETPSATEGQLKEEKEDGVCPKCGKKECVCQEGCKEGCSEGCKEGEGCECNEGADCDCKDGSCDCGSTDSCGDGSKPCGDAKDPQSIGWDIEGQTKVNEEAEDDDVDLGIDDDSTDDVSDDDEASLDAALDSDDEDAIDGDDEEEEDGVEPEVDIEDSEEDSDTDTSKDDEIASIRAELEALTARLAALEGDKSDEAESDEFSDEDFDSYDTEGDDEGEDDDIDLSDDEGEEEDEDDAFSPEDFDDTDTEGDETEYELYESRIAEVGRIVDEVVKSFINEDELHDFGKHPGYRKKPMTLPQPEVNDAPFGQKIGDGNPYEMVIDQVAKNVMAKIMESVKDGKKKVK